MSKGAFAALLLCAALSAPAAWALGPEGITPPELISRVDAILSAPGPRDAAGGPGDAARHRRCGRDGEGRRRGHDRRPRLRSGRRRRGPPVEVSSGPAGRDAHPRAHPRALPLHAPDRSAARRHRLHRGVVHHRHRLDRGRAATTATTTTATLTPHARRARDRRDRPRRPQAPRGAAQRQRLHGGARGAGRRSAPGGRRGPPHRARALHRAARRPRGSPQLHAARLRRRARTGHRVPGRRHPDQHALAHPRSGLRGFSAS